MHLPTCGRVEDERGNGVPPRFPTPLIKPDVRISRIRLSDWIHRKLTNARPSALADVSRPGDQTPVPRRTGGCLATTPCGAFSESALPFRIHTRLPPGMLWPWPPG